jgi:hypothetical protein
MRNRSDSHWFFLAQKLHARHHRACLRARNDADRARAFRLCRFYAIAEQGNGFSPDLRTYCDRE